MTPPPVHPSSHSFLQSEPPGMGCKPVMAQAPSARREREAQRGRRSLLRTTASLLQERTKECKTKETLLQKWRVRKGSLKKKKQNNKVPIGNDAYPVI